jgi:hypothetical protein
MAVYEIAKTTPYVYKCGLDEIPSSQCLYSAFFYADELAGARATFAVIRKAIDEHAQLGPDVEMFIKRGCTEYELACGPSDQYTFADELPEIEASLLARFRKTTRRRLTAADGAQTLALWIRTAFKHKDDTYLDFTAGRPIFPPTVRYSPTDGSDRRPSGTTGSPLESEPPSPYQGANPRM